MNRAFLVIALIMVTGACSSSPTSPSVNVPFSTVELRAGTGTEATAGRTATVRYTGWVYNTSGVDNKGAQFDSGGFTFVIGSGVIAGFSQGVVGMRVGGLRRIIIPPSLAYGNDPPPNSGIPRNATLIFEVELVAIQ